MASMDQVTEAPYNFTGGVNIEQPQQPRNVFQRFVSGMEGAQRRTAERQARGRDPLYDLRRMTFEQGINANALQLSDQLYQKQLGLSIRGGQQKLNIMFANALGDPNVDPQQLLRDTYLEMARSGLTDKEGAPYIERAQFMIQHKALADRFSGGPAVGANQTVTTKLKDPVTGVEYTIADRPETKTGTIKNLEHADKLDSMATELEGMGMADQAAALRRNSGLLRSQAEGGPSSHEGMLLRTATNLRNDIAAMEAKVKAGKKYDLKGGIPAYFKDELPALKASLAQTEREISAYGNKQPATPVNPEDPLGLKDD
jgi:hypothetical protein